MSFVREIKQLLFVIILAFVVVALSAAYWAIIGPDTILVRDDNPRLVEAESRIARGKIYDRQNNLLAESIPAPNGIMTRTYPHPEVSSLIGYSSLRYGTGGAEAAYDIILRGDDQNDTLDTFVAESVLHQPQTGSDVRLTLDLAAQQQISSEMQNQRGGVVVMSVPDGEILALVSNPTYDANTLDTEWETLIEASDDPFFNRVLQGQYQPGGTLQTPIMAALLLTNRSPNTIAADATNTVQIDGLSIPCSIDTRQRDLTFRDAYAHACPTPFVQFASQLGVNPINEIIAAFQLDTRAFLSDFITDDAALVEATLEAGVDTNIVETAVGQGELTISPLNLALVVAAITSEGAAPQPRILDAVRVPNNETWQDAQITNLPARAFITTEAARQLRDLMIYNAGIYDIAASDLPVGAHVALSYSGEETQAWFYGFAQDNTNRTVVVVVVLEQTDDIETALDIGAVALEAGVNALSSID